MATGHGFTTKMGLARQLDVDAKADDCTTTAGAYTITSGADVANWATEGVEKGDWVFVFKTGVLADIRQVKSISTNTLTVTEALTGSATGDASCWGGIDYHSNVPTVLGSGDQIPIISEGITDNIGHVNYVYKSGSAGVLDSDQTFRKYSGTVTCQAMYETIERIMCYTLGFSPPEDSPGGPNTGSSVYLHHFEMRDDLAQTEYKHWEREPSGTTGETADLSLNRFTLGIDKEVKVWEYDAVMINRMRLSCTPERTVVELDVVARDVDRPATGDNSSSSTWTFTSSTAGNQNLLFQDLVVRIRERDRYTISSSNDSLKFTQSSGPTSITLDIADGDYSGAELAVAIKDAADALSSLTYTTSYDEPSQKFTFSISSGTIFIDVSASEMCLNTTTGASTIGFTTDPSTATSIVSDVPAEPNGGALDSDDKISISAFELVVERNLDIDSQSTISGLYIEEPTANDFYRITGSFTIPRYKNDNFLSRLNDDDIMIADLIFTGNSLAASTYLFKIFLSYFKFTSVSVPVTDAGALSVTHTFEAFNPTIVPVGDMGIVSSSSNMEEFMWVMTYDGDDGGTYCITEHEGDIYAGNTVEDQVYRMNESTQTWAETSDADPANATTVEAMVSFGGALYVGLSEGTNQGEIWKTTDKGANWTLAEDIASVTKIHDLKVVNVSGTDYICAATTTGTAAGFWYSSDGASWTNTTDADITGDTAANCIFQSTDGKIWVGTTDVSTLAQTLYMTTNFNDFTSINVGADLTGSPATVHTIVEHRGRMYCGCNTGEIGRLEWDATNWDLVVDIGSEPVYGLESYQGALWAITGTTDAILYYFTEQDFDTTNRKYDLGEADGLCIYAAPNGIMYVGTGTGSKIFARRPMPPLIIHVNNQLANNPSVDREPIT